MYAAELFGTALLVFAGLSVVIGLNGEGSPLFAHVPEPGARRALTGFLFGSIGAAIAFSPLGRISGAHINPAVTFAFWLEGKINWRDAGAYVAAQCAGAVLGAMPLLMWGDMGRSLRLAATLPSPSVPVLWPLLGEALCTGLLVGLIFAMAAHKPTQPFTPLVNPPLFAFLVWLEAPLSGASANPARSLGPAVVAMTWQGHWIYWLGPSLGAAFTVALFRTGLSHHDRPDEARLFHFGHPGGTAPQAAEPSESTAS
jgi:aquaporin Z